MSRLNVFFENQIVGIVHPTEAGKLSFCYVRSWIDNPTGFPISISLPLQEQDLPQDKAQNFFANLLPEGNVRKRVCKKLGISVGNDFELLKAIGGDCAGALTVTTSDEPPSNANDYELITNDQLARWSIGAPDAFSEVAGQSDVRLSLAGAQDKLPVMVEDGKFYLPKGNSPSTHILKFSSADYSHLPENETFTTMLAKAVGLPVVNIRLFQSDKKRIAVVERYDRQKKDRQKKHPGYARIHQEDFCQALGVSPNCKYEKEGGPNFRACGELIKQNCSIPAVELENMIRWSLFNLLVHNADAHGKNISFLFQDGQTRLTPFYDLVCTRNYNNLDRNMAMTISGGDDPNEIRKRHLEQFATELGVSPLFVTSMTIETQEKILGAIPDVICEFEAEFGSSPILERIPQVIIKRINKTMQSF